ncbi:MAG: 23S rRNA (pseudouridine(1915)-N(3))-methyltransferase RlmH [Legionellales bacterium]|jgi:23S rRNA (pseudouridine1915-N3)-methyltransferase|nr:23S rRNA (pseudouridine(1915)-N(3))-methyltransferase RlmH [Legionellales bacterium]
MQCINIISIGHRSPEWLQSGCDKYEKILASNYKINNIALHAVSAKLDQKARQIKENELITAKIPSQSYIIALDETGKKISSIEFAKKINSCFEISQSITFIIGPTDGLSSEIKAKANYVLSLSNLTYTHDMVKVILLEQIFRAHCINTNHPYHRQ